MDPNTVSLLKRTLELAQRYLSDRDRRPVYPRYSLEDLRRHLGGPLPEGPSDPQETIARLADLVEPALVASTGPRYFGFVTGGSLPVALAADWLTSTWDQNGALVVMGPGTSVVEETAARWLLELWGLPLTAAVGFVTGCQMASFTALAAARNHVLDAAGWDVERKGLRGAPPIHIIVGAEAHVTIDTALRLLGLGTESVRRIPTDAQGRLRLEALRTTIETLKGPIIVCAQAGNVNTGAFDPLEEVASLAHRHHAWLHVDGAFGLWAAASPAKRHLVAGVAEADSWATDAHKWLNVPYDNGIAIVARPVVLERVMSVRASYLERGAGEAVDQLDRVPESSRRARGLTVYAALRSLGRRGVAELVERCCALAERMASRLREDRSVEILNDVVLNQVLVRFHSRKGRDDDALTRAVIRRVQEDGTCWLGGATWHHLAVMRVSISNWSTTEGDIDRSAKAIRRALQAEDS